MARPLRADASGFNGDGDREELGEVLAGNSSFKALLRFHSGREDCLERGFGVDGGVSDG